MGNVGKYTKVPWIHNGEFLRLVRFPWKAGYSQDALKT